MTMLVELIELPRKDTVYFDAGAIRCVTPSKDNPLASLVVSNAMGPGGFQSFLVLGNPKDLARAINSAREGKNVLVQ